MAIKFTFGADGEVKKDENYVLSDNELNDIKAADKEDVEDDEEALAEIESSMSIDKLQEWLRAKEQGISYEEFSGKRITRSRSNKKPKGHSRLPSKSTLAKRRMGRQETSINCRDKEAMKRTYVIEIANLKKLEEIKVFLYKDEIIQFSEIVNDAIEHYYECLKADEKNN